MFIEAPINIHKCILHVYLIDTQQTLNKHLINQCLLGVYQVFISSFACHFGRFILDVYWVSVRCLLADVYSFKIFNWVSIHIFMSYKYFFTVESDIILYNKNYLKNPRKVVVHATSKPTFYRNLILEVWKFVFIMSTFKLQLFSLHVLYMCAEFKCTTFSITAVLAWVHCGSLFRASSMD